MLAIIKNKNLRAPGWLGQLKCLTLDLSSGLDLGVLDSSPVLGSMLGMEPT